MTDKPPTPTSPAASKPEKPQAPNPVPNPVDGLRTFTLNSPEFYEAICEPRDRPWIPNGSLGREPRAWERAVIVERDRGKRRVR